MTHRFGRNIAAVVAIYAIALQGLLSAFGTPVWAPVEAQEIAALCRPVASDTPASPRRAEFCGKCLAGHCAAAAGCDRTAVAMVWPAFEARRPVAIRYVASAPSALRAQHFARAPPAG